MNFMRYGIATFCFRAKCPDHVRRATAGTGVDANPIAFSEPGAQVYSFASTPVELFRLLANAMDDEDLRLIARTINHDANFTGEESPDLPTSLFRGFGV